MTSPLAWVHYDMVIDCHLHLCTFTPEHGGTSAHLLSTLPYVEVELPPIEVPERPAATGYQRPPRDQATYVPDHVATLLRQ